MEPLTAIIRLKNIISELTQNNARYEIKKDEAKKSGDTENFHYFKGKILSNNRCIRDLENTIKTIRGEIKWV